MSLAEALLTWLSLASNEGSELTPLQVSDGILMSKVLNKIDPKHFPKEWMAKLKVDVSENVRLKAINLKRIVNAVTEFTNDVIGLQLVYFQMPDTANAAEGQLQDIARIIQLILGCAVNCDRKQEYIESMMSMDAASQQLIMEAIQEVLDLPPVIDPSLPLLSSSEIRRMMEDLEEANIEKDNLMQKCHNLEKQVNLLQDEKSNVITEYEILQKEMLVKCEPSMKYDHNPDLRQAELIKMLESAQEVEKERDVLQAKVELLERQLSESTTRESELQKLADQTRALKDEVDILRDASVKVDKYEAAIDSYKKKLEELGDLKRQLKRLEDTNTSLLQANLTLENDVKKTGNWKPQVDVFKKQIAEYHTKLESASQRSDKLEFESKKLLEQLEAVKVERDRLLVERDDLKETNVELLDQLKAGNNDNPSKMVDEDEDLRMAMIPPEVKENIFRLKNENKRLKELITSEASGAGGEQNVALQTLVDELKEREARLESVNRMLNKKILGLESEIEDAKSANILIAPRVPGSREELELKLADASKKISKLEEVIFKKDIDMQSMEERYKKYIEKAKSVIKTLDPKQNPNAVPEVSALRKQLNEKDALIETLEQETEKARAVREMEERLISSAFYNLSMQVHRSAIEGRLSSTAPQPGQSFLARQRRLQVELGRIGNQPQKPGAKTPGSYKEFMDF